jgi:hypothetical protein
LTALLMPSETAAAAKDQLRLRDVTINTNGTYIEQAFELMTVRGAVPGAGGRPGPPDPRSAEPQVPWNVLVLEHID